MNARPRLRIFLRNDTAAVMVEFALALVVFLSAVFGTIELGLAVWDRNAVAEDAREGARFASVHGTQSGRTADSAAVADYVKSKTALDNTIVVITTWAGAKVPGTTVSVTVKHAVPRRGLLLPAHTDSSTSTMLISL